MWIIVVGLVLLVAWVVWVLYIVNPEQQVTISLIFKVEQAEPWLDPFLRSACQLFAQASHLRLLETWVLATDDGEAEHPIVQRLQRSYPFLHLQGRVTDLDIYLTQAGGQVVWFFDLTKQHSPTAVLQALEQLLLQSGLLAARAIVPENNPM